MEVTRKLQLKDGKVVARMSSDSAEFGSQFERDLGRRPSMRSVIEPPQPTCTCMDPLNWGRWRKEIAFASLMLATATAGSLKTMLVTVNAVVATELNVSYMSATALTGIPLIIGALFGIKSQILAQCIGKRTIYLASTIMMLLAAVGNMHVESSYAEFLITRIFQGMGWGAFEALVPGSISDMFHPEDVRGRTNIYNTISVLATWGSPILGGFLSQNATGFRNYVMIINLVQSASILLIIFATPETTFARSTSPSASSTQNVATTFAATTVTTVTCPPSSPLKTYVKSLALSNSHSTQPFSHAKAVLPIRSLAAPSVLLTALLTAPLLATAHGIAQSLSLLFSAMPTFLLPTRIGFLFTAPFVFTLLLATLCTFVSQKGAGKAVLSSMFAVMVSITGLLGFGIYTADGLMPNMDSLDSATGIISITLSTFNISLQTVSVLFGLLVAGALSIQVSGVSFLTASADPYPTADTLPSSPTEMGIAAALASAHFVHQEIFVGLFTIFFPMWISSDMDLMVGLKDTSISLTVVGIVVSSSMLAIMWTKAASLHRGDAMILGLAREGDMDSERGYRGDSLSLAAQGVPMQRWKTGDSFSDL